MIEKYGYYFLSASIIAAMMFVFWHMKYKPINPAPKAPVLDEAPSYLGRAQYSGSVANPPQPRLAQWMQPEIAGYEQGWNSGEKVRIYH